MTRDEIIRLLHLPDATMPEELLAHNAEIILSSLSWLKVELFQPEGDTWSVEAQGVYRTEVQEWNPETKDIAQITNLQGQPTVVMKKVHFVGRNYTFLGVVSGLSAHPLIRQIPGIVFLDDDSFNRCWMRRAKMTEALTEMVEEDTP